MIELYYDTEPLRTIDEAYGRYKESEFESPHRSTIPLLSWLKHEPHVVEELLDDLAIPTNRSCHLEFGVKSPKGKGPPSQTDLMVISEGTSLAVECKWTEPVKETLSEWYHAVNENNGPLVLQGWLQLLQRAAENQLDPGQFSEVINQMIHRAASACGAAECPSLAYLVFRPSMFEYTTDTRLIRDELAHLWRLLGRPKDFPFFLVEVEMKYTKAFERIAKLPKKSQETTLRVKDALASPARLFHFESPRIERLA
ncbi:hypothetical protein N9B88_01295 [Rubripirellula sp.]|nr:hypothetical protein [Rubripirellula sp.]